MKIKISSFLTLLAVYTLLQTSAIETTSAAPFVTIWVHGTKLTPTIIGKKFFYRLIGMHSAEQYDTKYHKRTIADLLCEIDPEHYAFEHFYFWGWNGKLCFLEREKASQDLYEAMLTIINDYQAHYNGPPKIRIITHSHGGNVVLNLANIQTETPIIIDELILLGCPVQEKTKHYIQADCFKKVYSFYSSSDIFQIIDLQGFYKNSPTKKIFSERRFTDYDKLQQAHIKFNGRSAMHIEFLCRPFLKHLPALCHEVDELHNILAPNQKTYVKIINIHTKKGTTQLIKTIKDNKSKKICLT